MPPLVCFSYSYAPTWNHYIASLSLLIQSLPSSRFSHRLNLLLYTVHTCIFKWRLSLTLHLSLFWDVSRLEQTLMRCNYNYSLSSCSVFLFLFASLNPIKIAWVYKHAYTLTIITYTILTWASFQKDSRSLWFPLYSSDGEPLYPLWCLFTHAFP